MKRIRRLDQAPSGLADYIRQARANATWDGFSSHRGSSQSKRELAEALSANQHGLCGYCEIDLHADHREIEHVIPQSDRKRGGACRTLDVGNMLVCCRGNAAASSDPVRHQKPIKRHLSCGQAKADTSDANFLDPRDISALPSLLRVLWDGEIEADENACSAKGVPVDHVNRTISILRLNVLRLKDGRAQHLQRLKTRMKRYQSNRDAWRDAAKVELLPDESNVLHRFFTTTRSYFGDLGEDVLAESPQAWI